MFTAKHRAINPSFNAKPWRVVKEYWRKAASLGEGRIFHEGQCRVTSPVGSIAVCYSGGAVMPLLIFSSVQRSSDWQIFNGLDNPTSEIAPFPWEIYTPSKYMVSWAPVSQLPNPAIGLAIFAGLTNVTSRQTDSHIQADHANPFIAVFVKTCAATQKR